ncbi:DNA recombination protein RmuC [Selenomonadales bacterium OttesenSCG-928-I06]|nr:DNA recombination protein RmuC [Selenomonadales bacterium OttesenSCG-928-I06]
MDFILIAIIILNLIILMVLLAKLKKNNDQETNDKYNAELLIKLSEFKSEIIEKVNEKNTNFARDIGTQIEELKTGNRDSLDKINETLNNKINDFQKDVFEKFQSISESVSKALANNRTESNNDIEKLKKEITDNLSSINKTLEEKIAALQTSNEEKLEKMRGVVEEKLEKTLNERLKLSFDSVSKNLESVQKGLGEMQNLATDVGGLKKAITNVKTRGVFGEVQLERILEQMLTPAQYEKNTQVKSRSQERVEFAIKLPGKNDDDSFVYLPIDSKFPSEDYDALLVAYENGDKQNIDKARIAFTNKIKLFAKEISSKYINPPTTTDFAILFLPFESLYAEVVQAPGLFEELQTKYKITITGPTTLSAFLNALQMGFKTLAIEKHSSEVWNILGAIKTEFKNFENALSSVQKKLRGADDDLSKLVGRRTNAINRKLRDVQELPETDTRALLPDSDYEETETNTENE